MDGSAFYSQIQMLEQRLNALHQRAAENPTPAIVLEEVFEELQDSLEELHVADEELRVQSEELQVQSEELTATRLTAETEHKRYQELFDSAPDGYMVTDAAGVIHEANRAAAALLAVSQEELRGKPLVVFVTNGARHAFHTQLTRLQAQESVQDWEVYLQPRRGVPFPAAITVATVRDQQGSVVGLRWLLRNITARKQAEEALRQAHATLERRVAERTAELQRVNAQLQAELSTRQRLQEELLRARELEALGTLAGGIAHDFNNLLAIIFGAVSLAKMTLGPYDKGAVFLAEAENVRSRALALTNKLLTFAPAGKPVRRPTSIADLITASSDFALQGSSAGYDLSLPGDLWPVNIDPGQMQQVLHNVVTNAVEAMPQGGIVRVRAQNVTLDAAHTLPLPPGPYVEIAVSDQGSGIPAEHGPKIFDPYFTTKEPGRGLGLAIAYAIVTKHDGCISVESVVGTGTTVRLYLPVLPQQVLPEPQAALSPPRSTGKILVMDDEEALRELTRQTLTLLGYTVDCARDGTEALARLRALDPQVRAIVSSGYSTDPVMADFGQYGFSGVLVKPYTLVELGDLMRRVVMEESV